MAKTQSSVRKLVKPEYSAEKNLTDLMDATVALYKNNMSLQAIAEDFSLNPIKVRKLLITAGVYQSDIADAVQQTFQSFRTTQDYKTAVSSTMIALHLSRPSVTSYLPYEKGVYFPEDAEAENISAGAERQRHYRAVTALKKNPCESCFICTNVQETDLAGHGENVAEYAHKLRVADEVIGKIRAALKPDDIMVVMADHGNDPTIGHPHHTREKVPLLIAGSHKKPQCIGERATLSDVGATAADYFHAPAPQNGRSFLPLLR